jgi:hypothetical protein
MDGTCAEFCANEETNEKVIILSDPLINSDGYSTECRAFLTL